MKAFNQHFATLAVYVGLALLGWASPVSSEQLDPVQQFLLQDCVVGEDGSVADELADLGDSAVPALVTAVTDGPDANLRAQREANLAEIYAELQAFRAAGESAGSDPDELAAAQSQTSGEFVASTMDDFVRFYRIRGVQGLGVVGGAQAVAALRSIESGSSDPELRRTAADTLAQMPDLPQEDSCNTSSQDTTRFSCADLRLVMSSVGRKATGSSPLCRVDTNRDGIINGIDMAYVLKRLPSGTACR